MAEIQKSMKTMGKAMTQLGKGADFDDDLFEEQSHAQVSALLVRDKEDYVYAQPTAARQSVVGAHYVQPQVCY